MKRESFLVLLGVLIILSPFSGLPLSWLTWVLLCMGVIVVIIGITLRRDRHDREVAVVPSDT
ncbi:hypothetical protein H0X32_02640 [Patescibacteria group bacterium]|nr:hypothetical protein [Patescibacteria group bacterium]